MGRALWWCSTIVAAFQLQLFAAEASTTRVPVSPSVSALASRVELDVRRDRARFAAEIIRRIYAPPASRRVPLDLVDTHAIAALAGIVTMTPGTLSAEVSPDRSHLIVHALHVDDPETIIATIKSRYETPLKEICA